MRPWTALFGSLLLALSAANALAQDPRRPPGERGPHHPPGRGQIRVTSRQSKYAVAPGGVKGRFVTGQEADLMLGGIDFNNTGGPLLFNHPTGLASDGKRFLVADRWNNRVLVWKSLPTRNSPPDLVLGQKDFKSNNPGTGRHELNWPGNVAITLNGAKVAVADTNNDRLLIWNSFPQKNGAPADVVLDLRRFSGPSTMLGAALSQSKGGQARQPFGWPWGVWTDGKKLAAIVTHGSSMLVWNSLPTRENQPPDLVITPRNAGTPRNITSDGTFLIISDHNYGEDRRPASYFWRKFPTSSAQEPDFVRREWLKGTLAPDGKLILAGLSSLYIWKRFPRTADDEPDVTLRPDAYRNGDGPDTVCAGGRLYACNYNGNNILVWNRLPTRGEEQPDYAIGSDNPRQSTWQERGFITNPVPATDGKSLFISSDFDRKLLVWRQLPDESGARADVEYSLPEPPWDNALHGQTLALAGKRTIYVWKKLPLHGELPDLTLSGRIGSVELQEVKGVALDDHYFYLSDRQAQAVYVWEGIPQSDSEPKFTLKRRSPGRLSSDGQYLAVAPFEGAEIELYRVDDLGPTATPIRLGGPGRFNLPGSCLVAKGHLFVADTCFNRVHVWHRIGDALAGHRPDALLGKKNDSDRAPEIGRDKLFWPATLAFDGSYLWVGEFKFSTRVLRFSPRRPAASR